MEPSSPEDHAEQIKQALFAGEKIEAIKLYREQTKLGLAESKTAVETLERELRSTSPGSFTAPASKGCGGMTSVILLCIGAGIWWFVRRQ